MRERSINFFSDCVPPCDGKYFVLFVNRDRDQTPSNYRRLLRKQGFLPHRLRLVNGSLNLLLVNWSLNIFL